jgi:hypothetical protein
MYGAYFYTRDGCKNRRYGYIRSEAGAEDR